ncbi:MAG: hypothetical protein HZB26_17220 [Candidatus Hydrogenedentes bacterium]|nr:hypothetical protein [Candidatus Hydrogenedentota bacterium]
MTKTIHTTLPFDEWGANARLAADTLEMKPAHGVPSWMFLAMDIAFIEQVSGHAPGAYRADPDTVYLDFQRAVGACMIDQYLAANPGTMTNHGYDSDTERAATTGAAQIARDGIVIDSPEAVAEHLERFVFPRLQAEIRSTNPGDPAASAAIVAEERRIQTIMGPDMLKVPYVFHFPGLRYGEYGYEHYLTAYLIYPELIERDFALQSDLARLRNTQIARAVVEGGLPKVIRLDHDMADSRGLLVDVRTLDRLWFPHFSHAIQPLLDAGIRLIWHCDGNLMQMVPRLLEAGIGGFQGFQYEDGMDYERICAMRTREGDPLMIWAGVSVTRTLPSGTPDDVRREIAWLVKHGPKTGLFLGPSSSIVPGTPWNNLQTMIEGLAHYREHGRS